jgi:hypothetical protein
MVVCARPIQTLEELRTYIRSRLCLAHELDPDSHPFTEKPLKKNGEVCGRSFCVHGPRAMKVTAIWDDAESAVFFYGPTGERLSRTVINCNLTCASPNS